MAGYPVGLNFNNDHRLRWYDTDGVSNFNYYSTAVFRDVSAWYHIVMRVSAGAFTIYVNNTSHITGSLSSALQSGTWYQGSTYSGSPLYGFNGYLANTHFIDGQALTPASFAETDATTGAWNPKAYSGSYGTNGFYLQFADNSSNTASTLGKDYSGLGNNWTPNNLSVTAGAGNDSLVDSPTNYGTDTGVGGEVRGNYATWNPLQSSASTLANGNLDCTTSVATGAQVRATIAVSSSKWYWEVTVNTTAVANNIGIIKTSEALAADRPGYFAGGYAYVGYNGNKENNASASSYGATYGAGDIIGVALDLTAGTLVFYKNGTSQGTAYSSLTGEFIPCIGDGTGGSGLDMNANFGQRPFAYTAPSGYKALCTQNLPAPLVTKSNTVFDVVTYTGTGASRSITGLNFNPDFVWIKPRSVAEQHELYDAVRGTGKVLFTDYTDAEATRPDGLTSFNSDGFSLGDRAYDNGSGKSYVAWTWDAGTSTVTNTQGSITSQVRANASAGFSVVGWSGSNSDATVGHGLNVQPSMIIAKPRSSAYDWKVLHFKGNNSTWGAGYLNQTAAFIPISGDYSGSNFFDRTAPTSSVFSVSGNKYAASDSGSISGTTYIAYCFSPVVGYSSFGSYTGNGSSDGTFVYTGFRPKWLMIKRSDASGNGWYIMDATRNTYNVGASILEAQSSGSEYSASFIDFLSNGFKLRATGGDINSGTIIYAAFAEAPFNYSRAR
jgi:hypothetical protein